MVAAPTPVQNIPLPLRRNDVQLVCLEVEHAKLLRKWMSDPGTLYFATVGIPIPQSVQQAEKMIRSFEESADAFLLGVSQASTNETVGFGCLGHIDWKNRSGMVGLLLGNEKIRGRGLGRDALHLLLDFAFGELNLKRVYGDILPYNLASQRMCERLGFVVEGIKRQGCYRAGDYHDLVSVSMLREDWLSHSG